MVTTPARVLLVGTEQHRLSCEVVRLVGVVASQKRGQPLNGVLELRMLIDECAHPSGQPLDAELFLAASVLKLLDAAIGEIHGDQKSRAAAMSSRCSTSCTLADPAEGAAIARREIRRSAPSRCGISSGRVSP